MDVERVAANWARTWTRAWLKRDIEAIVSLYAERALYRALSFREPDRGPAGVRRYLTENFGVEEDVECWFGEPIVGDERAAVEWWATWIENGQRLSLAGATILRFDAAGLIVDHRDYWNMVDRREEPYQGW